MGPVAIIELGEVPLDELRRDPPARPWRHRRVAFVVAAAGLALVLLGGAAPAARPLPLAVLNASADASVVATADRVFVVDAERTVVGRGRHRFLTAYRLMDLHRLWRIELPVDGAAVTTLRSEDTIIVSRSDFVTPPDGRPGSGPETAAVDAATGDLLWRHDAYPQGWTPDGHVLMTFGRSPRVAGAAAVSSLTLGAVSARTGTVRWSVDVPPGVHAAYRSDGDRLTATALVDPSGRVQVRDPNTGRLGHAGRVAPPAPGGGPGAVRIVGDVLLVRDPAGVAAYGLDDLDLRWRLAPEGAGSGRASRCGDGVCFVGEDARLRSVDPRTGRVRWSGRWTDILVATERSLLVSASEPATDDYRVVAVDPDTGRPRQDLGRWDWLDRQRRDDWLIGYQFDLGRAVVSRVDPARGARVVAVLHEVSRTCQVQHPMLVCRRLDHTVGIWRLPG